MARAPRTPTANQFWRLVLGVFCLGIVAVGRWAGGPQPAEASRRGSHATDAVARIPRTTLGIPHHKPVVVAPFVMDRFEVTNEQYRRFITATGHHQPGFWQDERFNGERQPVVGVSWEDARAYCEWAGGRLPSEIEWMAAAQGPTPVTFPWGDVEPDQLPGEPVANYNAVVTARNQYTYSSYSGRDGVHYTAPVGSFPRGMSRYGVQDLSGNVSEWVDGAGPMAAEVADPGRDRMRKGGSWLTLQGQLQILRRQWSAADLRTNFSVGLRCAGNS